MGTRVTALILVLNLVGCSYHYEYDYLTPPDDGGTLHGPEYPEIGDSTMPTGKRGWSSSGTLRTKKSNGKVNLQVDFTRAPAGPGSYTVQFRVERPDLNTNPDTKAVITWKVEGNQIRREVSVGNGVSVTGVGEAVEVNVTDSTLTGTADLPYTVTINVAPGTRAGRANPPVLRGLPDPLPLGSPSPYVALVGPLGSVIFPIPPDAGAISADIELVSNVASGVGVGDVSSTQESPGAGNIYKTYYPLIDIGFVPLMPSATFIQVQNGNAVNSIFVSCLFGIDG